MSRSLLAWFRAQVFADRAWCLFQVFCHVWQTFQVFAHYCLAKALVLLVNTTWQKHRSYSLVLPGMDTGLVRYRCLAEAQVFLVSAWQKHRSLHKNSYSLVPGRSTGLGRNQIPSLRGNGPGVRPRSPTGSKEPERDPWHPLVPSGQGQIRSSSFFLAPLSFSGNKSEGIVLLELKGLFLKRNWCVSTKKQRNLFFRSANRVPNLCDERVVAVDSLRALFE